MDVNSGQEHWQTRTDGAASRMSVGVGMPRGEMIGCSTYASTVTVLCHGCVVCAIASRPLMRVASQGKLVREVEPEADSDVPVTNQLMPGAGVCPANLARAPRAHTRAGPRNLVPHS